MPIIHTEYRIAIVSKKSTRSVALKDGRRFTQEIDETIGASILKAARATVRGNIKAGKLSKRFAVTMDS
jgi:hypothetical protein